MRCPKCKVEMEFDTRRTGFFAYKKFWYCDNPHCEYRRIERIYQFEDSLIPKKVKK